MSARDHGELARRLLTAAVALPPATWILWRGGWPLAALCSAAAALATWEYVRLALGPPAGRDAAALLGAALLPWLPLWLPDRGAPAALATVGLCSLWAWGWHVLRQDVEHAAAHAPLTVQALVFCALGPYFLSALRVGPSGREWAVSVVAVTFANDAFAYGGGKLFGRHRVAPKVSPGKSWEGVAAGTLGAALSAAAASLLFPTALRPLDAGVLAAACSVLGPIGDLSKSLLKRARGVKDAGRLFPGHGGMLDRIDALLVNVPAIWAWVQWGR